MPARGLNWCESHERDIFGFQKLKREITKVIKLPPPPPAAAGRGAARAGV